MADLPFGDDEELVPVKSAKVRLLKLPFAIQSQVGAAIRDYDMIRDGDRVLVALSGGKDSLSLLHVLKYFQSVAPIKFDIGAVTIDPMVVEYQPKPLIKYMERIGVPYWIESDALVERAR
jgi:tRNA 2-thiocytidine biosynthesis protein TtcA